MIFKNTSFKLYSVLLINRPKSNNFILRKQSTFIERYKSYWKNVANDYYEAILGIGTYSKENPLKSMLTSVLASCMFYCAFNNPDEENYWSELLDCTNSMLYISPSICSPNTVQRLEYLSRCNNSRTIKRLNLLILSIIWIDDFDDNIYLYKAQCTYLKPSIFQIPYRVVDIGFLNTWWYLKQTMVDYDVNPNEWKNDSRDIV
ncbi:mitochondrial import inner membrane translocase subunit Tim29 [Daktulosphaira vitifoliae]|uniref:mitochondrial import inner membrane translocase subunit Tim29 n=1 Tax=Daktulosphaira vitifoliae TaxID=58002 RepID=UPI0021AA8F4B|nr:mitochondrial import inner membrane translocase subunit Tim29 [Daktulosphaira vitifoliae]